MSRPFEIGLVAEARRASSPIPGEIDAQPGSPIDLVRRLADALEAAQDQLVACLELGIIARINDGVFPEWSSSEKESHE